MSPKKKIDTSGLVDELTDMSFFKKPAPAVQEENKEAGKQESMRTSLQENTETSKPGNKDHRTSTNYPKVTYQLDPDVIDMLEDAKRTLKKQHKLKVSLNAIVEEAIRMACEDLEENKETSKLVNLFTRKQYNK
jgi:uncharacterized protein involved in copper resistance